MGADTKSLRTRIRSVDSTLHLTKAMELVASSKMRRANEAMLRSREYLDALRSCVSTLALSRECAKSPYMKQNGSDIIRLIVIVGDRGLAGGYNANVMRTVREIQADNADNIEIIPVGKRLQGPSSEHFTAEDARETAAGLCEDFTNGKYGRLGIVCTEYISAVNQQARVKWVLPVAADMGGNGKMNGGIIFEPDEMSVLKSAVPLYVAGEITAAVRESFACEVAARRAAMNSAGRNAKEMIDSLQLEYNRARQGAITQEITEIVAGSGRG